MQRRALVVFSLLMTLCIGIWAEETVLWWTVGYYKGEAFFSGRPTTYWKGVLGRCDRKPDNSFSQFEYPQPPSNSPAHAVFGDDPAAIPVLLQLARDENANVRQKAIEALSLMHPIAREAIPCFINALSEQSETERRNAAWALGECGKDASEAIPVLVEAIKTRSNIPFYDHYAHLAALEALKKIDLETCRRVVVPELLTATKDKVAFYRSRAIDDLRDFRDQEHVLDTIITATKDSDGTVRATALWSLSTLGFRCEEAVPCIKKALKDTDEHVREAAAAALREQRQLEEEEQEPAQDKPPTS